MGYLDNAGLAHFWQKVKNALSKKQDMLTAGSGITIKPQNGALTISATAQSNDEVYSTAETRIGTWVDGKPIYRKIYQGNTPTTATGGWYVMVNDAITQSIDTLVNLYGSVRTAASDGETNTPIPYIYNSDYYIGVFLKAGKLCFSSPSFYRGQPATVIIEYTKH